MSQVRNTTKEHHSRAAGVNQRMAATEKDKWDGLVERANPKQQDEDERQNSNQFKDKKQTVPQKSERSHLQSKQQLLESR